MDRTTARRRPAACADRSGARPACRRRRPCRPGRDSRSGSSASSAAAGRRRAGRAGRGSSRVRATNRSRRSRRPRRQVHRHVVLRVQQPPVTSVAQRRIAAGTQQLDGRGRARRASDPLRTTRSAWFPRATRGRTRHRAFRSARVREDPRPATRSPIPGRAAHRPARRRQTANSRSGKSLVGVTSIQDSIMQCAAESLAPSNRQPAR